MKSLMNLVMGLAAMGVVSTSAYAQTQCATQYSVLSNINCGGGQSTCYQSKTAYSGGVRCTCTATCLSTYSISGTVGATKAVQWGVAAACLGYLVGTATGGTMAGNTGSITSSVFASVSISGGAVLSNSSSTQQVDCFGGTIRNDDDIVGLC